MTEQSRRPCTANPWRWSAWFALLIFGCAHTRPAQETTSEASVAHSEPSVAKPTESAAKPTESAAKGDPHRHAGLAGFSCPLSHRQGLSPVAAEAVAHVHQVFENAKDLPWNQEVERTENVAQNLKHSLLQPFRDAFVAARVTSVTLKPAGLRKLFCEDFQGDELRGNVPGKRDGFVSWRSGSPPAGSAPLDADRFIASLLAYRHEFRSLEDCSLNVADCLVASDAQSAKIRVFLRITGADEEGRQREDTAWWRLNVRRNQQWQIASLGVESFDSVASRGPWFEEVAEKIGVTVRPPENIAGRLDPFFNGRHGVTVGDPNEDGWPDLYLPRFGANEFFLNLGDGTFRECARELGIADERVGSSAAFVDLDRDGDQDLVLLNREELGPQDPPDTPLPSCLRIYEQISRMKFEDRTEKWVRSPLRGPGSALVVEDLNRDGTLDLFLAFHNRPNAPAKNSSIVALNRQGQWLEPYPVPAPDGAPMPTLTASASDVDRDGWPEVYAANDFFSLPGILVNARPDTFLANRVAPSGIANTGIVMSTAWGDLDNDGLEDLMLGGMFTFVGWRLFASNRLEHLPPAARLNGRNSVSGNRFFRNRGDGTFEDATDRMGLRNSLWAWGTDFLDVDNDGDLDLYSASGFFSGEASLDC